MGYKKELDKMIWSFSRVHAWEQCSYSFYLKYIEKQKGIDNFWAENGSAIHLTLENIFSKNISIDEAPGFYIEQFENICSKTKITTMDNVFISCLNFLCEYDFSFFDDFEILGVEKKCSFNIGKYRFQGFIDLLLSDKKTKEIIIWDHKSSAYPFKKDGVSVLKSCQENFQSYKHQMYLYCKQVVEEFNVFPSKITWLHFKDGKTATIDFNKKDYEQSLKWAEDTINKIYKDNKFEAKDSYMMCGRLCNFREECEYKMTKGV